MGPSNGVIPASFPISILESRALSWCQEKPFEDELQKDATRWQTWRLPKASSTTPHPHSPPPPPHPRSFSTVFGVGKEGDSQDRTSVHARLAMPNKYEIPSSATVGCVPTRSPFEPVNLDSIFLQGLGAFSTGCTFSSVSRHLK